MRVLIHKDLDLRRVKLAFTKVRAAIEADDFRSPDVKKLHVGGYYYAKLDHSNRLLLQFARPGAETVCLALEVIANHDYDKSHFLRGAPVDEAKIESSPPPIQRTPAPTPGHCAGYTPRAPSSNCSTSPSSSMTRRKPCAAFPHPWCSSARPAPVKPP